MRALVVDIKHHALDDGPGIRSTVFFKGCPLRCSWCHNPEMISARAELGFLSVHCLACRRCQQVCSQAAIAFDNATRKHRRDCCRLCGSCVDICPAGALTVYGVQVEMAPLVEELKRDQVFYRNSGGGVTLSGGEPTRQLDFLSELARNLHQARICVLLQTCGLFCFAQFRERVLPHLDMIYFDIKIADSALHKRHTQADNAVIVDNLRQLADCVPNKLLVRIPLVPGISDTNENLVDIAKLLRSLDLHSLALLPYNPLGLAKWDQLGRQTDYPNQRFYPDAHLNRCREIMRDWGLVVV